MTNVQIRIEGLPPTLPPGNYEVELTGEVSYRTGCGPVVYARYVGPALQQVTVPDAPDEAERTRFQHEMRAMYPDPKTRGKVNVHRLANVIDALLATGVIQPYMIGLPYYGEGGTGRQEAIERWLRNDEI